MSFISIRKLGKTSKQHSSHVDILIKFLGCDTDSVTVCDVCDVMLYTISILSTCNKIN